MRSLLTVLSLALVGGCASVPVEPPTPVTEVRTPASVRTEALLARLGDRSIGAPVELATGNVLGSRRATVIDAYRAASGRRCRRLVVDGGELRLICRETDGLWTLQRRLGPVPPEGRASDMPLALSEADEPVLPVREPIRFR